MTFFHYILARLCACAKIQTRGRSAQSQWVQGKNLSLWNEWWRLKEQLACIACPLRLTDHHTKKITVFSYFSCLPANWNAPVVSPVFFSSHFRVSNLDPLWHDFTDRFDWFIFPSPSTSLGVGGGVGGKWGRGAFRRCCNSQKPSVTFCPSF